MVGPVGGSAPVPENSGLRDAHTPSQAVKSAVDALWSMFNSYSPRGQGEYLPPSYADLESGSLNPMDAHWLNMLPAIVNNLMTQFKAEYGATGPSLGTDPTANAIYNLVSGTYFTTSGGAPGSLASVCAKSEPTRTKDLLTGFSEGTLINNVLQPLDNGSGGCAIANWWDDFRFETPTTSTEVWSDFITLQGALGHLANNPSDMAGWDTAVAAILNLNKALSAEATAGTQDGFSFFLQTYVDANFTLSTAATQQSLLSLATAIQGTTGGSAKDPTDIASLQTILFPATGKGAADDLFQNGWIGGLMQVFENPYDPYGS